MIGIVVVSHGLFGQEIINAVNMILGSPIENIISVGVAVDEDALNLRQKVESAVKKIDSGNGVILLSDMFGGSPSNISLSFLKQENVEVISGVNMPMLIKLLQCREEEKTINEIAKEITVFGRENIILASEV